MMSERSGKRKASDAAQNSPKRTCYETIQRETLWPDGDVLLLVEHTEPRKLLVSSTILSATSPVFKAMLNGHFKEGQASRSPDQPLEIELDDDIDAGMADMCALLHHRMEIICDSPWHTSRLELLALTIDKYDCKDKLQLQTQALISHYLDRHPYPTNVDDAASVMKAAYLLDDGRAFNAITNRLILRSSSSFSGLQVPCELQILPERVLWALDRKRERARHKLVHGLMEAGMPPCPTESRCHDNYDSQYVQNLKDRFEVSYWPPDFDELRINFFIQSIRLDTRWGCGIDRGAPSCIHTQSIYAVDCDQLKELAEEVEEECTGLCLRCVKNESSLFAKCEQHDQGSGLKPLDLPLQEDAI